MPRPEETPLSALRRDEIICHPGGGMTFAGQGAVEVYRAIVLCSALRLLQSGIKPNRHTSMKSCLAAMGEITGKKYRRKDADAAVKDVKAWIDAQSKKMVRK